jgi:hypothetical protein
VTDHPLTPSPASPRWRLALLLVAVAVILAAGVVYLAAVLWLPGDGAYILLDTGRPRPQLEAAVRAPQPGGLQTGDIVFLVAGRAPDDWLAAVWQPSGSLAAASLEYQVRRGGALITVNQPLTHPAPLSLLRDNWSYLIFILYLLLMSAIIVARRPYLLVGQLLLLASAGIASSAIAYFLGLRPSDLRRGWIVALYFVNVAPLYLLSVAATLHFALVFPRVQPVLQRRPWLAPSIYGAALALYVALASLGWAADVTRMARLQRLLANTQIVGLLFSLPVSVTVLWVLRRISDPVERRQVRWVAWGAFITIVPWTLLSVVPEVLGRPALLPDVVVGLLWCALPTSLSIAILRERLFDIDVLVNRTLVYGVLSGLLALVYFGAVVVLQAALVLLTGRPNSQLVTVLSTLAMAAVAAPLRARVQSAIDRRFYRRRYDAGRTLAAFGQAARTMVDLEPLSDQLLEVVEDTMQPAHVSLTWVRGAPPRSS